MGGRSAGALNPAKRTKGSHEYPSPSGSGTPHITASQFASRRKSPELKDSVIRDRSTRLYKLIMVELERRRCQLGLTLVDVDYLAG